VCVRARARARMCACERLCEEKTMPLLHEAVVGAHMSLWCVVLSLHYATFAWGCCGCPHESVMRCTQSAFCVVICR